MACDPSCECHCTRVVSTGSDEWQQSTFIFKDWGWRNIYRMVFYIVRSRDHYYDLGPYQNLSSVIDHFADSFGRIGMAARRGFNPNWILDPALSDSAFCE